MARARATRSAARSFFASSESAVESLKLFFLAHLPTSKKKKLFPSSSLSFLSPTTKQRQKLQLEDGTLRVYKKVETRAANATHGLVRALASNMVVGTSTGFTKTLTMIGIGYRSSVAGDKLTLNLGYSHPIEMEVPKGLEVKVEKTTTIHITGADKAVVGQFAADIRKLRPPEPYKGKGVRYEDEFVRRKEGKRGK